MGSEVPSFSNWETTRAKEQKFLILSNHMYIADHSVWLQGPRIYPRLWIRVCADIRDQEANPDPKRNSITHSCSWLNNPKHPRLIKDGVVPGVTKAFPNQSDKEEHTSQEGESLTPPWSWVFRIGPTFQLLESLCKTCWLDSTLVFLVFSLIWREMLRIIKETGLQLLICSCVSTEITQVEIWTLCAPDFTFLDKKLCWLDWQFLKQTTHQHSSSNLLQILNWNSHWLHIQPLEWSIGTKNKIGKLIKNLLIWGNDFIYLIFRRTIYLILRRARTDASWNPSPMAYRMYNLCWGN